jgi:triosephosphate isomerase (TIM)
MRQRLVIGNWKQNGSIVDNAALLWAIHHGFVPKENCIIGVCVPAVYLYQCETALTHSESHVTFGLQNCSATANGAFTGEIAASMAKDFAARWIIVGHSERRQLFGETNEVVAQKAVNVLKAGLTPIVCVGETLVQREAGETEAVVKAQLQAVISALLAQQLDVSKTVVAYEPVWAIGTGKTASNEQAQEVHAQLRAQLATVGAESVSILYGGSVKPSNAAGLFVQTDIDGGLIGGASLFAKDFLEIYGAL